MVSRPVRWECLALKPMADRAFAGLMPIEIRGAWFGAAGAEWHLEQETPVLEEKPLA